MIGLRSRDHSALRTTVALLGGTLLCIAWGIAVARWSPSTSWGFGVGYLGTFVLWPAVVLALLLPSSGRASLGWCVGLLAPLLLLAWL